MATVDITATSSGTGQSGDSAWSLGGSGEIDVGAISGAERRCYMLFDVSSLAGATINSVTLKTTKQLDTGLSYTHWSTVPYNTNGSGDPRTDAYSTAYGRAAIANQYRTNDNFNQANETQFTLSLPAQAVTDLTSAIAGAGLWTLCQGLDTGSEYGGQTLGLYSHSAATTTKRPTLTIDYTAAAGGSSIGFKSLLGVGK